MDWRRLHAHRTGGRGAEFYRDCLAYAQVLWRRRLPARALLCLDRALGADLAGGEPVLAEWPLPFEAVAWMLLHAPSGAFLGNPRVHFQHYAGRMNAPRREQRRWRAWACWAITRSILPDLPGDPNHRVAEPSRATIPRRLRAHGIPGESALWGAVLARIRPVPKFCLKKDLRAERSFNPS
jgi:hypothetical protein